MLGSDVRVFTVLQELVASSVKSKLLIDVLWHGFLGHPADYLPLRVCHFY